MKHLRTLSIALTLLIVLGLALVSCAGSGGSTPATAPKEAAKEAPKEAAKAAPAEAPKAAPKEAAKADFELKVGLLIPRSGPFAVYGNEAQVGIDMAVDELAAAGVGPKITLLARDTAGNPATAVTALRSLIDQEQVAIVLGPMISTEAIAALDTVNGAKVPQLISNSSNDSVTNPSRPYTFRPHDQDFLQAQALVQYLVKEKKYSKIALIADTGGMGQSGAAAVKKVLGDYKLELVSSESYNIGDTDFTPQIVKSKGSGAEAVILWGTIAETSKVIKGIRAQKWDVPITGAQAIVSDDLSRLAGKDAEGVVAVTGAPVDLNNNTDPAVKKFVDAFHKKTGTKNEPHLYPIRAYDAIMIAHKAAQMAGSADRQKITDVLNTMTIKPSMTEYKFTPTDHQGVKIDQMRVIQVKNGVFNEIYRPK